MDNYQDKSHEVEYQLIGSCLKDGKVYPRVKDIVGAEYFHSTICQDVWKAMQVVDEAKITVDQVTVGDQLQRIGIIDRVNYSGLAGRAAISRMRDEGSPKNAEAYAYTVQDYYGKREQLQVATQIASWSQNGRRAVDISTDGKRLLEEIEAKLSGGNARTVDSKTAASRTYDLSVSASRGKIKSIKTGLPRQ